MSVAGARRAAGMSQARLSVASGAQISSISRIENGLTNPTVSTLSRLSAGMGKKLKISYV